MFAIVVSDEEISVYRQITSVLKQLEAEVTVAELLLDYNVSTATLCQLRAKYGSLDSSMIKQLKELEAENARLRGQMPVSSPKQCTRHTQTFSATI